MIEPFRNVFKSSSHNLIMKSKPKFVPIILISVIVIVIISGLIVYFNNEERFLKGKIINREKIQSDTEILTISYQGTESKVLKLNTPKKTFLVSFDDNTRPSLDWIKENTPPESKFLSWWDHGGLIKSYTQRRVVVASPSKNILSFVASFGNVGEWNEKVSDPLTSDKTIKDVALALSNKENTREIMKQYGADYILIKKSDKNLIGVISSIAEEKEYNTPQYNLCFVDEKACIGLLEESFIKLAIEQVNVEDFELVYTDESVVIYRLRN